ncbi:MAG: transglutaminase family protein [Nocardiaceae bacterium]|nr:transglutaminase family protein [Nocardiaceae bacterium]
MRRYRITHTTTYEYSNWVSSSYGRGYLTPRDTAHQTLVDHGVTVDPQAADFALGHDSYGNSMLYFHVTEPHCTLVVTGTSTVEVDPVAPDPKLLAQPWEKAIPDGTTRESVAGIEFVLDLDPPEITADVRAYAATSFTPGRPIGEAIADLNHRIFTDFTYESGATNVSTRVAEVLRDRSGVCQDFARLAVACLRSVGLAGRYVSGYLATDPPPGKERMIGVDATHAWADVRIGPDTWLGFDPTNDQFVDERYVVVAWGRDYADVPPLRGVIYTEAESSTIHVSVDVAPLNPIGSHA